jgi:probable rRNA maturation factor
MTTIQDQQPQIAAPGDGERTAEEEPPSRWRLELDLVEDDGDWSAFDRIEDLVDGVRRVLEAGIEPPYGAASASAAIALSSDEAIRQLNAAYRAKDAPTNVLSFPAADTPPSQAPNAGAPRLLGDVILAVETVLAEAAASGISPAHHFQHLLIHGVLHLIGYDHQTDAEAEAMESLETELLAHLGISDPYAGDRP